MKKFIAFLCVAVLVLSSVAVLAACAHEPTEVELTIAEAEKMTLAQLEAAAQEEFEAAKAADPSIKFVAKATTSGVSKVLTKFQEKYSWFEYDTSFKSDKDTDAFKALDETVAKGNFWADFTMIQIASSINSYVNRYLLLNYVPQNDNEIELSADATQPLVGLYADKLFVYNKSAVGDWELKNIWQLTGADGATLKKAAAVSFQDPTNEGINMAFLTSLTSPESVEKLTAAYKSYFGTDYKKTDSCKNIGYHFVEQFVQHCGSHGSDSKVLSEAIAKDTIGTVYVVGLNKVKGYVDAAGNTVKQGAKWYDDLWYAGVHGDVEGYNGYTYNTYLSVPSTSRLPYTACLFARYILTEEGFRAGWSDVGYSSPNAKVTPNVDTSANNAPGGSYSYELNPAKVLQEVIAWTSKNTANVRKFVAANWNA